MDVPEEIWIRRFWEGSVHYWQISQGYWPYLYAWIHQVWSCLWLNLKVWWEFPQTLFPLACEIWWSFKSPFCFGFQFWDAVSWCLFWLHQYSQQRFARALIFKLWGWFRCFQQLFELFVPYLDAFDSLRFFPYNLTQVLGHKAWFLLWRLLCLGLSQIKDRWICQIWCFQLEFHGILMIVFKMKTTMVPAILTMDLRSFGEL